MTVAGIASLNRAIVRTASLASSSGLSPSGVPGRGFRKFIGTSCGASSASWSASSTRCSRLSPMPRMPPLHSSMPVWRTSMQVSQRSCQVCEVQISGKKLRAASRLWL